MTQVKSRDRTLTLTDHAMVCLSLALRRSLEGYLGEVPPGHVHPTLAEKNIHPDSSIGTQARLYDAIYDARHGTHNVLIREVR